MCTDEGRMSSHFPSGILEKQAWKVKVSKYIDIRFSSPTTNWHVLNTSNSRMFHLDASFKKDMASTGRKLDPVWADCDEIAPNEARYRKCPYEVGALVDRMRTISTKFAWKNHNMSLKSRYRASPEYFNTLVQQPQNKNKAILALGDFFFSTNNCFRAIESSHFKKHVNDLHPGYQPPSTKVLPNKILEDVYAEQQVAKKLSGSLLRFALTVGETNNEPIVCCSNKQSSSDFLVKAVSTVAEAHPSEYVAELTKMLLPKLKVTLIELLLE